MPSHRLDLVIFAGGIGLSSALLFTLELLSGRLVLPAFGGSPAVWTTALAFYTAMIFLGYAYAHRVAARDTPRARAAHVALLFAAATLALVAMTIDPQALRVDALPDVLGVLLVLAILVGLPAFAFGTTTPLLSSWYARGGRDPWFLYAMSNAASLAALLAYPLILEPRIGIAAQRAIVVIGAFGFAVLVAIAARRGATGVRVSAEGAHASPSRTLEAVGDPGVALCRCDPGGPDGRRDDVHLDGPGLRDRCCGSARCPCTWPPS